MSAEDELSDIKKLLSQIRDQNAASAGTGGVNAADLDTYTRQLKLARQELDLLEKGTSAYNRKQKEVESLVRKSRNALNDQRSATDMLILSTQGLTGALSMVANAADKVIVKITEMIAAVMQDAKELDDLTIGFQAATGASAEMAANMGYLTDRLRLYGVSSSEASAAVNQLYSGFTGFTRLNMEQQAEIGRTVALMNELGVSFSTSTQILESGTRTLGMSLGETESLIMDLRATAMALEVPIENLTRDFTSAENMIAALGKTGPDSFNKLAASAKATGVEVGTILGLVEKFDTFEGAASAVQALNAVLGGNYLDSISMVQEVDPAKRFEMLRNAVLDAGHSVESLANSNDYYLKKSLAATLDLDVSTFMKVLSGDIEELTGSVENASYSFEQMTKDAFGLKGFDQVVNGIMGAFKRPITEIQKASRAVFEGLTPTITLFEKYNKKLIDETNVFVKKNAQLVGVVGLLYNLANIDAVQKGYEIFKGIADFTMTTVSGLFSIKGLLFSIAGGALFLIRKDLNKIYKTFTGKGGFQAGISMLFSSLKTRFKEFQVYLDTEFGFNKGFVEKGLKALLKLGMEGFHFINLHVIGPIQDYIVFDFLQDFETTIRALEPVIMVVGTFLANALKVALAATLDGAAYAAAAAAGINFSTITPAAKKYTDDEIKKMKETNTTIRENRLKDAAKDRRAAVSTFTGTRGFNTIETQANKAIKVITPQIKRVADTAEKVGNAGVNALKKTAAEIAPAVAQGFKDASVQVKVYQDGKQLPSDVARAEVSLLTRETVLK